MLNKHGIYPVNENAFKHSSTACEVTQLAVITRIYLKEYVWPYICIVQTNTSNVLVHLLVLSDMPTLHLLTLQPDPIQCEHQQFAALYHIYHLDPDLCDPHLFT